MLAVGGYKSEFLANLIDSYPFEKCNSRFKEFLWKEMYRDDGLLVFPVMKFLSEIKI